MGRGKSVSIKYNFLKEAFVKIISELEYDVFPKHDFYVRVYEEYFKLSGHMMHTHNCYASAVKRIQGLITKSMFLEHGWKNGYRTCPFTRQTKSQLCICRIKNEEEIK